MEAHAVDYKQWILDHGNPKAKTAAWHKQKAKAAPEWSPQVTGTSDQYGNSVPLSSVPDLERMQRVADVRNQEDRALAAAARRREDLRRVASRIPSDGLGCHHCGGPHYAAECRSDRRWKNERGPYNR